MSKRIATVALSGRFSERFDAIGTQHNHGIPA
jgi:hypothetical protein